LALKIGWVGLEFFHGCRELKSQVRFFLALKFGDFHTIAFVEFDYPAKFTKETQRWIVRPNSVEFGFDVHLYEVAGIHLVCRWVGRGGLDYEFALHREVIQVVAVRLDKVFCYEARLSTHLLKGVDAVKPRKNPHSIPPTIIPHELGPAGGGKTIFPIEAPSQVLKGKSLCCGYKLPTHARFIFAPLDEAPVSAQQPFAIFVERE